MKLPLIQKIEILEFDPQYLQGVLAKNYCGMCPTVFLLHPTPGMTMKQAVEALKQAFLASNIDPRFPYPSYIQRDLSVEQDFFTEVDTTQDVPRHFVKKIKRMKKREQTLHTKTVTLSERITNHPLSRDLEYIEQKSKMNKSLRDAVMEKKFYFDLLLKLKRPNKEEKV